MRRNRKVLNLWKIEILRLCIATNIAAWMTFTILNRHMTMLSYWLMLSERCIWCKRIFILRVARYSKSTRLTFSCLWDWTTSKCNNQQNYNFLNSSMISLDFILMHYNLIKCYIYYIMISQECVKNATILSYLVMDPNYSRLWI